MCEGTSTSSHTTESIYHTPCCHFALFLIADSKVPKFRMTKNKASVTPSKYVVLRPSEWADAITNIATYFLPPKTHNGNLHSYAKYFALLCNDDCITVQTQNNAECKIHNSKWKKIKLRINPIERIYDNAKFIMIGSPYGLNIQRHRIILNSEFIIEKMFQDVEGGRPTILKATIWGHQTLRWHFNLQCKHSDSHGLKWMEK